MKIEEREEREEEEMKRRNARGIRGRGLTCKRMKKEMSEENEEG